MTHMKTYANNPEHKLLKRFQLCLCARNQPVLGSDPSQEELVAFYRRHAECKGDRVTSPQARRLFADLSTAAYIERKAESREREIEREEEEAREMVVRLEEEMEEQTDEEEEEEEEEEVQLIQERQISDSIPL